jgi:hypothetical protein
VIVLHTLGESVVEVGSERVGPASPHVFGLLLYLGVERGRRESRSVLQALFFPEASEKNANHSLRQLVYKARQLGAPLDTEYGGVRLCPESVRDDYTALIEGLPEASFQPEQITGGWVPGYAPTFSAPFAEWLEERRARIARGAGQVPPRGRLGIARSGGARLHRAGLAQRSCNARAGARGLSVGHLGRAQAKWPSALGVSVGPR